MNTPAQRDQEPPGRGPRRRGRAGRPDPDRTVLAVNSVIAAVGTIYVGTHSIAATVVAGCAGLACAAVIVWKR